jgi:cellulose synthase/poly-beta-1,6-N-acetylglucosamine synthase-like glycosyltransferase
MSAFQRYVALYEEGCYYVDSVGRQVLGHPVLFSGCCTLFRLDAVERVGGFTPGHLTEDLDLSDRLWLAGWKGVYRGDVVNHGEVPFAYEHFRRQQERWAAGSARALREFFWSLLTSSKLSLMEKLSALRQNAYFAAPLMTGIAILLGAYTVAWLSLGWNTYEVEYYLLMLGYVKTPLVVVIYACIISNFIEPLVMILVMKRRLSDLPHLLMMVWYAWSVLPTYVLGNIKGLLGVRLDWFRTPKFLRSQVGLLSSIPLGVRTVNVVVLCFLMVFYFAQAWQFGWFDEFSLLLIPAFILACKPYA